MMRSVFSGVSGLKNHQTRMDVIGNNISNVNTTGFKSSRVTFTDTLNQTINAATAATNTLGGTNPKQVGLGSAVGSVDLLFNDGSVQSTGKNTDLCLTGNALFVVKEGQQTYYTRDGAFEFDGEGNYVLPGSGLKVQGWNGTDGVLDTSAAPTDVNVQAGKSMEASATVLATYANNLNAAALTIESISGGTPTAGAISTINASTANPVTITDGTSTYKVTNGSFSSAETYTISPAALGAKNIIVTDSTGKQQSLALAPAATQTVAAQATATNITGGIVTTTASNTNQVTITIGTNNYAVTNGTFSSAETYTISPVATTDTTITVTDSNGVSQILTLAAANPPALATPTQFNSTNYTGGTSTRTASVANPVAITDGTNTYEVTNGTFSGTLTYKISPVNAGDATITITDNAGTPQSQTLNLAAGATVGSTGGQVSSTTGGTTGYSAATASTSSPITLTMSDGSKVSQTSGTYTVGHSLPITTTLTIYDTLGNVHNLPVYFTKTAVDSTLGNSWTVSLKTDGSGTTTIDEPDGSITTVTMPDTTVDFTTLGKYDTAAGRNTGGRTTTITLTNGALGTQTVTLELSELTQYAGNNTINGTTDGYAAGTLESISIDATGTIYGTYTNGVKQAEAQVAVAQFTNASGLTKTGSSLYQASSNSGTPNVKTTTDLGVKITPSALEMSNVDIANEFADMIITQRGFQSNSKMITVGDEMLETVINMKR